MFFQITYILRVLKLSDIFIIFSDLSWWLKSSIVSRMSFLYWKWSHFVADRIRLCSAWLLLGILPHTDTYKMGNIEWWLLSLCKERRIHTRKRKRENWISRKRTRSISRRVRGKNQKRSWRESAINEKKWIHSRKRKKEKTVQGKGGGGEGGG